MTPAPAYVPGAAARGSFAMSNGRLAPIATRGMPTMVGITYCIQPTSLRYRYSRGDEEMAHSTASASAGPRGAGYGLSAWSLIEARGGGWRHDAFSMQHNRARRG